MRGATHELIGGGVGVVTAAALNLEPLAGGALVVAAMAASKLPDKLECGLIPHRTVTHTPLVAIALAAAGGWAAVASATVAVTIAVAGLVAGYWLHLMADACTPHGIPGWPVRERLWLLPQAGRITTGSRREDLFVLVWCCGCAAAFFTI